MDFFASLFKVRINHLVVASPSTQSRVLRKQLASYIERRIKPRRLDHATRVSLALFTRLFDWRDTVVSVQPATVVRWHRLG